MLLLMAGANFSASPATVTFTDPLSVSQTVSLSGGTAPYSISTAPSSSVASATLTGSVATINPLGNGNTSIVFSDSAGHTFTVPITVGSVLSVAPGALTITPPTASTPNPTGTATISGGNQTSLAAVSSDETVATASITGTTLTITSVGPGTCVITITDADNETATVSITVAFLSGRILDFKVSTTAQHVLLLPPRVSPIVIPPWEALPADGSPVQSGLFGRRHVLATAGGNMLYNPKANGYLTASAADLHGWNTYSTGTSLTWRSSSLYGGSFQAVYAGGSTLGTNLLQQLVGTSSGAALNVNPNTTYTFSAMITTQSSGRGYLQVQTVQNSVSANSQIIGVNQTSQLAYVTFTTGASDTQVYVKFVVDNNGTTGAATVTFYDPQLEQGNYPTPFNTNFATAVHDLIFDGAGAIRQSTPMNTNIPNQTMWRSNMNLWVNWPSSSSTATYWIDDGSGNGGTPTIWRPDNSQVSGVTSLGGTSYNANTNGIGITGLTSTSGSKLYFCIYYVPGSTGGVSGTGWFVSYKQTAFAINDPAVAAAYADGGYMAFLATTGSSASVTVGVNGGGIKTGGGGGGRMLN